MACGYSYIHMTDLVDQMFPPIHRKWTPEFTDFNFWKAPVQEFALPDFSPPSPALSARSDTSNQSTLARLRNFSLGGPRQSSRQSLPATMREGIPIPQNSLDKDSHLRQMSSLERLGSTLASLTQSSSSSFGDNRRSLSPASRSSLSLTYADSGSEDEEGDGDDGYARAGERKGRRRSRTKSITSMPGSLDDMRFGDDDDGEDEHVRDMDLEEGYGYEGEEEAPENEEEAAEDAFDEDFFATGEMKNVPFL